MSIIKDVFFGGAEKDAAQAQERALEGSQEFIKEGIEQAREDINRLYPEAQNMIQGGFQGALDVFGQTLPQQADVFQQGNVGAQQALLSGLPQMNAAILGQPIDYSAMQPQTLSYDPSIFSQQLPSSITDAIASTQEQQQPQPAQAQTPFSNIGGVVGGGGTGMPILDSNGNGYFRGFPLGNTYANVFGGFGATSLPQMNIGSPLTRLQ